MPKVALYARYSSDLQNPQSIDDQLLLCRQLAEQEGWEVVDSYFDKAISGASIRGRVGLSRLLADVRDGCFDVVCAEALDRISRDQEDIAHVHKALCFAGVTLHTVAEGVADEMQIGLRGTMNELFLKDLAAKTHRGQRGRVEKGRSGGGLAYGYDVAEDEDGEAGGRTINETQALVVRRIFQAFAMGENPNAIAEMLNREVVPGPAGRTWAGTTIRGHRVRGTGILNNELYCGVLVWNRLRYIKDPQTGKRQARMNPESVWIRKHLPDLRIVEEPLWQAVKERQCDLDRRHAGIGNGVRNSMRGKARGLVASSSTFCHLLICAQCDGDFCNVGRERYGCANHYRSRGCGNGKTVQRRVMEQQVRRVLSEASALIDQHATQLVDEEQLHLREQRHQLERDRRELEKVDGKLNGLMAAIEDGLYAPRIKVRFQQLEDQATRLCAKLKIQGERMENAQKRSSSISGQVKELIAHLQTNDDNYAVLRLRRMIGPISVSPGPGRRACRLFLATELAMTPEPERTS